MAGRYLVLTGAAAIRAAVVRDAARGLVTLVDRPGLVVLADPTLARVALPGGGFVLGSAFAAGGGARIREWRPEAARTIRNSRGGHLVHANWGGYVALLPDGDRVDVIRAPFGELPCLFGRLGDGIVLASDIPLLRLAGLPPSSIDWTELTRHLGEPDARSSATCLTGIDELRGGDRLTLGRQRTVETLWSPWSFCTPDRRIDLVGDAVRRVRDTTLDVVGQRARDLGRSLLLLSGGLDSSVLAASLAHERADFSLMTLVTEHSTGDERAFARAVADQIGRPLDERYRRLDHVDLGVSAAAHLPRPVARAFEQDSNTLADFALAAIGGDAVLDGGGGDNIFCSLASAAPVADALLAGAGAGEVRATARSIADMADASLARVLWRGWRRSHRPPAFPRRPEFAYLSAAAAATVQAGPSHPWLDAPSDMLPGKAAHVALLVGAQALAEDADPLQRIPMMSPLLAQPLVEACLRVPSWRWFERGRNRAVARTAFDGDLPETIAWRRSKGTPDSFMADLFDTRRAEIRAMLLDGLLAGRGLLDRVAIADATAIGRPVTDHSFVRIMRLVDVESWARAQLG